MDINQLVKLTSRAWSLNILALLHEGVPGRQAVLLSKVPAGRTAFAASLEHLMELGLVKRNAGHGHPLRPEFVLTERGKIAGSMASKLVSLVPDEDEFSILRRNWTLPILSLTAQPVRFSTLKTGLGSITDRALSQSLVRLEERAWLKREIEISGRHPFPIYLAANQGLQINKTIGI